MITFLKHYGVPGQRWGIRRKRSSGSRGSADHRVASKLKKKKLSEMSNEELKKLNSRLQLERQYKELRSSNKSAGSKFVSSVLREAGKNIASKYVTQLGNDAIQKVGWALNPDTIPG